jgi:hypothetical protein
MVVSVLVCSDWREVECLIVEDWKRMTFSVSQNKRATGNRTFHRRRSACAKLEFGLRPSALDMRPSYASPWLGHDSTNPNHKQNVGPLLGTRLTSSTGGFDDSPT